MASPAWEGPVSLLLTGKPFRRATERLFEETRALNLTCSSPLGAVKQGIRKENPIFKTIAAISLAAALAFPSGAAFAEQGDSTAWGTVG
jgi:hypothetical protein